MVQLETAVSVFSHKKDFTDRTTSFYYRENDQLYIVVEVD